MAVAFKRAWIEIRNNNANDERKWWKNIISQSGFPWSYWT